MGKTAPNAARQERGNFVSEWFRHRLYPMVAGGNAALADQRAGRCPFLSDVLGVDRECVKPASSHGICTISSPSNGPRQDWLVCPYRALDRALVRDVVARLFDLPPKQREWPVFAAPTLANPDVREEINRRLAAGKRVIVYFQDKLGGEISLPPTDRSPELAFDITFAEVSFARGVRDVERYGILEVQTMDFHGSYRHAVGNLKDALRLHQDRFPEVVQQNHQWLGERVEGPNIANVFKRTFYQMILKFRIGEHSPCVGSVLAIPQSVWDSWQRHLGKPELDRKSPGVFSLRRSPEMERPKREASWIYVFDVDETARDAPSQIVVEKAIAADAHSLSHYALEVVPEAAVSADGSTDKIIPAIRRRLDGWWPADS